MNDMRAVIVPKSDQINGDDLIAGPITIEIAAMKLTPGTEQPVTINYVNDGGKPYKCCKSMARVMVQCWGPDASIYTGRAMTLYRDPKVKWGGMAVGGIRISHMSHIDKPVTMALTATKGSKKLFTVYPLKTAPAPATEQPKKRTMGDWLVEMETTLGAAKSSQEVQTISRRDDVLKVLDKPGAAKDKCNELFRLALARFEMSNDPAPELAESFDDDEIPF